MKTEQEYNAALEKLGRRSHASVMTITALFALVGAFLIVLTNQGLWGIWIPFCFLVIPTIFFLANRILHLSSKTDELEKRILDLEGGQSEKKL